MATATEVAAYIVNRGIETGNPVRPMELQRLIYLAQHESCARRGVPLVDEEIMADVGGAIVPSVWRKYCLWGALPIRDKQPGGYRLDPDEHRVILQTITRYGKLEHWHQTELVKAEGGPWHRTVHSCATLPAPIDFGGFDGACQLTR